LRLLITITPFASTSEVVGRQGEGWKIRVATPPERGRANKELLALLSDELGVPRAALRVVSGHTARRKVLEVEGLTEEEAGRRLEAAARR
jgi:uncharacterized protein (TIGR00251 family)